MSACEVIGSIFLSTDQLLGVEQLAVGAGADLVNHLRRVKKKTTKGAKLAISTAKARQRKKCHSTAFLIPFQLGVELFDHIWPETMP